MAIEIPIGDAVDRGDDARSRSEQRLHLIDHAGDRMGLEANDDEILRPKLGRVVGAAWVRHALLVADQQFHAVVAHRCEMWTARHQADVGARARQLHPEITADRARSVDTDLHRNLSRPEVKIWARMRLAALITSSRGHCRQAGNCDQAAAVRPVAVASSSKAVLISRMLITPIRPWLSITGRWRIWFWFIRCRTCSRLSVELQDTSCRAETSCEIFRLTPAAPCSAMARTTSRSVNIPTAVLPSVRTTSLTTSALILLARISWAAIPTVSFRRTVVTRAVFLRRMSPTSIALSFKMCRSTVPNSQTLVYIMPIVNRESRRLAALRRPGKRQ